MLAYDSAATIARALESLARQDLSEAFEVVVAWSGDERTAEIVAERFPDVLAVGRRERLLTGAARNLGLDHARGEIIAFLAADCEVAEDWLSRRVAGHRAGYACVAGAVVCQPGAGAVARASHLLEYVACSPLRPRGVVAGSPLYNLSFTREVFETYGRYEDSLACGEDTVFNWRLANDGVEALFDPAIRMLHREPERLGAMLRHQYWHGAWFGWLDRRHGAPARGGTKKLGLWWILSWYPAGRLARLAWRVFRWRPRAVAGVIALSPLLVAGVTSATFGLLRGWRGLPPEAGAAAGERAGAGGDAGIRAARSD